MRTIRISGGLAAGILTLGLFTAPSALAQPPTTCDFLTATFVGTDGVDTINGTPGNDVISAGAGNDTINGLGGNDVICPGAGNDTVNGGAGDDLVVADSTRDGADTVNGGPGRDLARYSARVTAMNISLDGVANDGETGEGDNIRTDVEDVAGSSGSNVITGNDQNNFLVGGFGDNTISAGAGDDEIIGGGTSTLRGGLGNDFILGGNGNDLFIAEPGPDGADIFDGSFGIDTASYGLRTTSVFVSLDGVANDGAQGEGDDIRVDTENITGGSGGDVLRVFGPSGPNGRIADNVLRGGPGQDIIDVRDLPFTSHDAVDGGPDFDICHLDPQFDIQVNCELP